MWLLLGLLLWLMEVVGLETPAGNASGLPCSPRGVRCWTPQRLRGLPLERFCDGHWDCPDGADESAEACQHVGVSASCPCLFQCAEDTECFPSTWICDGHADCEAGQDEEDCSLEWPGATQALSTARAENSTDTKSGKIVLSRTQCPLWVTAVFGM